MGWETVFSKKTYTTLTGNQDNYFFGASGMGFEK
jgi:hypothetical protein